MATKSGRCCGRSGATAQASAVASGGGLAGGGDSGNAGLARFGLAGLAQAERKVFVLRRGSAKRYRAVPWLGVCCVARDLAERLGAIILGLPGGKTGRDQLVYPAKGTPPGTAQR